MPLPYRANWHPHLLEVNVGEVELYGITLHSKSNVLLKSAFDDQHQFVIIL